MAGRWRPRIAPHDIGFAGPRKSPLRRVRRGAAAGDAFPHLAHSAALGRLNKASIIASIPMPRCSTASTALVIGISTSQARCQPGHGGGGRHPFDDRAAAGRRAHRRGLAAAEGDAERVIARCDACSSTQIARAPTAAQRSPLRAPLRSRGAPFRPIRGDQAAACALSPRPRPSTMPQAIASTFLTAPPISTPIGSAENRAGNGRCRAPRQRRRRGRHRGWRSSPRSAGRAPLPPQSSARTGPRSAIAG